MKNMRLTVCIGIMCGWLAAGMLHAGTRPDHVRPVEEDGSRLWLPVIRPVEGAEVEITYKGKVSPTIAIAIAELKNAWKGDPVLLEKIRFVFFHPPKLDCFMALIVCCVCRRRGSSLYLCRLLNSLRMTCVF